MYWYCIRDVLKVCVCLCVWLMVQKWEALQHSIVCARVCVCVDNGVMNKPVYCNLNPVGLVFLPSVYTGDPRRPTDVNQAIGVPRANGRRARQRGGVVVSPAQSSVLSSARSSQTWMNWWFNLKRVLCLVLVAEFWELHLPAFWWRAYSGVAPHEPSFDHIIVYVLGNKIWRINFHFYLFLLDVPTAVAGLL